MLEKDTLPKKTKSRAFRSGWISSPPAEHAVSPGPRIILHPLQPFLCPDSAFMASFLTAIRPGFTTPHGNGGRHIVRTRLPSLDTTDHPINIRGIKNRTHTRKTHCNPQHYKYCAGSELSPQAGRSGQFDRTGGKIRRPPSNRSTLLLPPGLDGPHLPTSIQWTLQ